MEVITVWAPQAGPQKALIDCPYPEVGFGGARGGGKTDGVLGKWGIKAGVYGHGFNAAFFRKEMPQQDDLIERAKEIYIPLGAHWRDQKKIFEFDNGGRIRFRPLESVADAEKYQGQNLSDAAIEEAGNYSSPEPIDRLFGSLRSSHGTPTQLIMTFNPGGPGHHWLRERYVKPAPKGMVPLVRKLGNGGEHRYIYIPSRVDNNKILLARDPNYINRLHLVGSPELVRAWLEGDFEIHIGSYFPEFGDRHICTPFPIPQHWPKYLGFDWGYHSPFCAVWGAISSGKSDNGSEVTYPKGSIVIYREAWGKGIDNVEIARKIKELSKDDGEISMVCDPSIFAHEGGASIADQFKLSGVHFKPADNDRLSGWSQIRQRLVAKPAMIYISTACPYILETLPAAPIDERHPEDIDTTCEDHGIDALRYLCKERVMESTYRNPEALDRMGKINIGRYVAQKKNLRSQPTL